jgi:hypothetical protein
MSVEVLSVLHWLCKKVMLVGLTQRSSRHDQVIMCQVKESVDLRCFHDPGCGLSGFVVAQYCSKLVAIKVTSGQPRKQVACRGLMKM